MGLLPEGWLFGLGYVLATSEERIAFAAGAWTETGWWWFFPYSMLVKTPVGTLALWALAAALGIAAWRRDGSRPSRRDGSRPSGRTAPLWIWIGLYGAVALGSNLNIGLRHVLPLYPALMILAGSTGRLARSGAGRVALAALLLLTAAESLAVRPHYLAFVNRVAGGPASGFRLLIDSNLDWGQDLPGLARFLAAERDAGRGEPCYLSYFGSALPERHGVACRRLPGFFDRDRAPHPGPLEPGLYAISASMLQHLHVPNAVRGPWRADLEELWRSLRNADGGAPHDIAERLRFARLAAHLRGREPDAQVGHSILIYRLDAPELRAAWEDPVPELESAVR